MLSAGHGAGWIACPLCDGARMRLTWAVAVVVAVLLLAGCGSSTKSSAGSGTSTTTASATPSPSTSTSASGSATTQIKKCSAYVGQIDTAADAKVVCTDDYGHNLQALDQKCENGRQYVSFGQHAGAFVGQKIVRLAGAPVLDAHNCKLMSN